MMCALQAGRRHKKVLLIDHAAKVGSKILISGGGRSNFTNTECTSKNFVSQDPLFCEYALKSYPPKKFIELVQKHRIPFHEKKLGQLFCDVSAKAIVKMLVDECAIAQVKTLLECKVTQVLCNADDFANRFQIETNLGTFSASHLVVATGGLSIPQIGASGFGYQIAKKFQLKVTTRHPALDGFLFSDDELPFFKSLAGVSLECIMRAGTLSFRENLLFTHKGFSGPAALQASLHWNIGENLHINLLPDFDALHWLVGQKSKGNRQLLKNILSERLPSRFAELFTGTKLQKILPKINVQKLLVSDLSDDQLKQFALDLHDWILIPKSTVGYNKAEVTRGGIDTSELSPQSMEAKRVPGLFFIGEVVDVTGWLGGYNFQWAWSSGWAAAQAL